MTRRRAARSGIRGSAVILAMLLTALAATIAATLFADEQRWTRTVLQRRDQVQAQALVMGGIQWARQILYDNGRVKTVDYLGEPWAAALPPIPLENGEIRGKIEDATGRINVNELAGAGAAFDIGHDRIARLFAERGVPAGTIEAIADWVDIDRVTRPNGAEDAFYVQQSVPGVAANAPVVRVAELSDVRGLAPPTLAAVAPLLTALPPGTPINVNTAPPEVLAALFDNAPGASIAALVADRALHPFSSVADFRARLPSGLHLVSDALLAVNSAYFFVTVEARQGTTVARARALLHRGLSRSAWPEVVWEVIE
jgi:general secretion pathway protein K